MPITLRFIIAVPMMQLFLFGYAINTNPKTCRPACCPCEHSKYERTVIAALRNSGYYDISHSVARKPRRSARSPRASCCSSSISRPNFDRAIDRGEIPSVLIDADATDPTAIGNATAALACLSGGPQPRPAAGPPDRAPATPPFQFVVHARYNPEQLTVLNIVPGLICIVLMISTLFMTTLSITKERERGTMENLLAMPVRPLEVMLAKIMPYMVDRLCPGAAHPGCLGACSFNCRCGARCRCSSSRSALFIVGNLALGITFSTRFGEPDAGDAVRPIYAAAVVPAVGLHVPVPRHAAFGRNGSAKCFPTTHAMRIVRGVLLKGNHLPDILPELWPIALFTLAVVVIAVWFYRETLD